jgi:hypothetical protein
MLALFKGAGGTIADSLSGVSVGDGGRDPGDQLEDKAAVFIPNQNTLLVNADFPKAPCRLPSHTMHGNRNKIIRPSTVRAPKHISN